jgi:hypothetical protein
MAGSDLSQGATYGRERLVTGRELWQGATYHRERLITGSCWEGKIGREKNREGKIEKCPGTELNRRHEDFQSSALPTELPGHKDLTYGNNTLGVRRDRGLLTPYPLLVRIP